MKYILPELEYAYSALEPYIDAKTMEIHHSKHHAGYTQKFNDAISNSDIKESSIEEIFRNINNYSTAIRNNGGGYYNHKLFWQILSPKPKDMPSGDLMDNIKDSFGSFNEFKNRFNAAAATRFGSGWSWLLLGDNGLEITSTPNQDNPLMNLNGNITGTPLIALDVWEHAYYLKYQNRRPEYIEAFWSILNWEAVERLYSKALV